MASQCDSDYFAARAVAEWHSSETATDPAVASVHAELAKRYENRASSVTPPRTARQPVQASDVAPESSAA